MRASALDQRIESSVRKSTRGYPRVVLAVSGGSDSMALLTAFVAARHATAEGIVATFDHGTGAHASDAVALVRRVAERLKIEVRVGRASGLRRREAAWRQARWEFLRQVGRETDAPIFTAHTQDDHVETVVMRVLRNAGARGIAGLLAGSGIRRPFLDFTRDDLASYCRNRAIEWHEDPANADLFFLRSRVRHELLPALLRARPRFREEMLSLSIRAATLREKIETLAEQLSVSNPATGDVQVFHAPLAGLGEDGAAVLWPALLARASAVADRRGIARLSRWSQAARSGSRVPISGGHEVIRRRDDFLVRRVQASRAGRCSLEPAVQTQVGEWRFYPIELTTINEGDLTTSLWQARLEATSVYEVRSWLPGDRLRVGPLSAPRRVARFFEDAGVSGPEREGWPVVVVGEEVVWIPGIRRGHAATARPGGPYVVYQCERYVSRSET